MSDVSVSERDDICNHLIRLLNAGYINNLEGIPRMQTWPDLFTHEVFASLVDKVQRKYKQLIHKDVFVFSMHAFVDFADNRKNNVPHDSMWHSHPVPFSAIMYLSNPEQLKTEFRDGISRVTSTERVWQLFDGSAIHRPEKPQTNDLKIALACDLDFTTNNYRWKNDGFYQT